MFLARDCKSSFWTMFYRSQSGLLEFSSNVFTAFFFRSLPCNSPQLFPNNGRPPVLTALNSISNEYDTRVSLIFKYATIRCTQNRILLHVSVQRYEVTEHRRNGNLSYNFGLHRQTYYQWLVSCEKQTLWTKQLTLVRECQLWHLRQVTETVCIVLGEVQNSKWSFTNNTNLEIKTVEYKACRITITITIGVLNPTSETCAMD